MANFAQERFDMGVEAAYLSEAAKKLTDELDFEIDLCSLRPRLDDFGHHDDQTIDDLNRLHTERSRALTSYHTFKNIADTIFGSFMPDRTRDSSREEREVEIADLMSGVNGSDETINQHFIHYQP